MIRPRILQRWNPEHSTNLTTRSTIHSILTNKTSNFERLRTFSNFDSDLETRIVYIVPGFGRIGRQLMGIPAHFHVPRNVLGTHLMAHQVPHDTYLQSSASHVIPFRIWLVYSHFRSSRSSIARYPSFHSLSVFSVCFPLCLVIATSPYIPFEFFRFYRT
jgi:hypothetical protein